MQAAVHDVEALLWCLRPALDLDGTRGPLNLKLRLRPPASRIRPLHRPARYESFILLSTTLNQRRALGRVIRQNSTEAPIAEMEEREQRLLLASASVKRARRLISAALRPRVGLGVRAAFDLLTNSTASALEMYRRADLRAFSGAIVSTQHDPVVRAFVLAAQEQSVPTIYVPHAPVASNNVYHDLPFMYAALRGEAERKYYESALQIESGALDVSGNLASKILHRRLPKLHLKSAGVLAVSPLPEAQLQSVVDTVHDRGLGKMIVAPHPRSDMKVLRKLVPADWTIHTEGRTLDLLKKGPPFLLQLSSGVAWEGAALGIPTANVRLGDSPPNYPFLLNETIFPSIRTSEEAGKFAEGARRGIHDRMALRNHALEWCSTDGEDAGDQFHELLNRVAAHSASSRPVRLHDGWGRKGVGLVGSWLENSPVAP